MERSVIRGRPIKFGEADPGLRCAPSGLRRAVHSDRRLTRRPQRFPEAGGATGYKPVRKAREKACGNEHSRLSEKAIFVADVLRQRPTEPRRKAAVGGV